jgi:H+/Cl- antiporter ClcA
MSKFLKHILIFIYVGTASGVLSSLFLHALGAVTSFRMEHPRLLFGLPLFGFFFGLLLKRIPPSMNHSVPSVLEEIETDKKTISVWTAPFIFIASIGTHLFGGSAGREGVGVLMGASAAHLLPKTHRTFNQMRKYLIYGGVAAGFASIFGTPWAGVFFAFELRDFKERKNVYLLFTTLFSALLADSVTRILGPDHAKYVVGFSWDWSLLVYVALIGIVSAGAGILFYQAMKRASSFFARALPRVEWRLFTGALILVLIVWFTGGFAYTGIGVDGIARSFSEEMSLRDFAMKCLLTILTLSVGFKGGEVTPLFFMGATLSNTVLAKLSFSNYSLSASLGMVSLFAAVTKTPLTCAIMAGELFGYEIFPLALGSCLLGSWLMKGRSIYRLS